MSRSLIERRLFDIAQRMRSARDELSVVDEQLAALNEAADEARVRSLVSETPLAHREYAEAQRHADVLARSQRTLVASIEQMRASQDQLLDRLMAGDGPI
jgi:chromosome segregation ATPase